MCAVLVLSILFLTFRKPKDKNGVPYCFPPGPKGWPIIGNAFQIPAKDQEPVLIRLAKPYREIHSKLSNVLMYRFTVKLGGSTWVYINSSRVIRELLDQ